MSIKKKFIILVILLTTIPTIFTNIISISSFHKQTIEMIEKQIIMAPKDESINLDNFFKQVTKELKIIGNMPSAIELIQSSNNRADFNDVKENVNVLNEILRSRKSEETFLSKISIADRDGMTISASNSDQIGKKAMLKDEELKTLKTNKTIITNVLSNDYDSETKKDVIIVSPIFVNDQYIGHVSCMIDMSYFQEIVNKKSFFKTGKAIILDGEGKVAASASGYISNNINENDILYKEWIKIKTSNDQNGIIEYNIDGRPEIAYYSKIENTDWMTLTTVEWREFGTPLTKNNVTVIIVLLVFLLLIIGSYILLLNHFSKPVYKLLKSIDEIRHGDLSNRFIYDKPNEFGQIAEAFNELMDETEKHKAETRRTNNNLQSLISNIPGGVYRAKMQHGSCTLDFISDGCLRILGYSEEEIKEKYLYSLINLTYIQDRKRVINNLIKSVRERTNFKIKYRIVCKDGSIKWVLDNGQIIKDENGNLFTYSVVTDITEAEKSKNKLRISEERYKIIMSQTEEIIFEVNIEEDTIYYTDTWKDKFKYDPICEHFSKSIYKSENIYVEDKPIIKELIKDITSGIEYKTVDIRMRTEGNNYIWCRIRVTGIRNEDNIVYKAIGVIIDIDKEKREAQTLLFKAQRDSLTNLYNKGTTQQLIEDYIHHEGESGSHAFFIIDIDDFKSINDNLGHLFGDSALSTISSKISNVFREDDVVGRIGGDEFIVLLKNIRSEELIRKKGDDLVQAFKESFTGKDNNYKVSGSIGISIYPSHGRNFEELYANADKALYISKKEGKDRYSIFSNDENKN